MDIEENDDSLHFTLFQNNRKVSIDSYVMEKTDNEFMREIFGYTESEHEIIGSSRRRVLRMFNQPLRLHSYLDYKSPDQYERTAQWAKVA